MAIPNRSKGIQVLPVTDLGQGREGVTVGMFHSISNMFFQWFSDIIDRVPQNSPSMHFRRGNTKSGGPIRIQEVRFRFRRAITDSGGPIQNRL